MAKVLFAKPIPSKKRIQLGILDEGEECTYTVSEATYIALGCPKKDAVVAVSDLGTIRFEDEAYRALRRAMGYLSLSDKSRFEIRMKLIRAGFCAEASDIAVERLLELGYLDEDRQLERAVEREANYKLRGKYYIKRKLSAKGYSHSAISRAIDRLTDNGEVDFKANFEILAEKKGAFSDEERHALEYKFGYRI